jgi:hypothetical protein
MLGCALAATELMVVVAARVLDLNVPVWAAVWGAAGLVAAVQLGTAAFVCTFVVLSSRNNLSFLPVRDYKFFVSRVRRAYPPA